MRNRQPFQWRNTIVSLFTKITGTRWLRLNYDGQTTAFVVGEKCTGDGGAYGTIVYLTSTTMYFASITGTFVNNEGLTGNDVTAGIAVANGSQY